MLNKNRLMGAIANSGLTQKELAKRIGVSKNTLNARINGKGYLNTNQIDKICEVLNIESDNEKVRIFLNGSSQNRDKETQRTT